jgi:hypothetical protein
MKSVIDVLSRVVAILVIATAVGCASQKDSPSQTSMTIESLTDMQSSVANAQSQVDRLMTAMNSLSSGNDLANAQKSFNAEVAELRASGSRAAARAKSLRDKEKEYIAKWQDDLGAGRNSTEKAAVEQRKAAVRNNYEAAKIAGQDVRQAYGPLNGKLTDIQRTLGDNATAQSVAQARPMLDQTRREAQELKNRLANFAAALNRMQSGMSQSGAAR